MVRVSVATFTFSHIDYVLLRKLDDGRTNRWGVYRQISENQTMVLSDIVLTFGTSE